MTSEFFGPLPPSDFNQDGMVRWLDQQVVSFQKIITGSLQADNELSSSNYVAGTSGWMIDGDGNAEFNDVTVRGTIYATAGEIGGVTVTGTITVGATGTVQSSNYSAGTAGWIIEGDGDAEFNSIVIRNLQGLAWTTFTPVLASSGTNPNIGSTGTATGRYVRMGNLVVGVATIVFGGTGISNGTGNYTISLPVAANTGIGTSIVGNGVVFDSGTNRFVFELERSGSSTAFMANDGGGHPGVVSATQPVGTFAANDRIQVLYCYEAA